MNPLVATNPYGGDPYISATVVDADAGLVRYEPECRPPRRKMAISGIYAIIHQPSGRAYIGSSSNVSARWSSHISGLTAGHHHATALLNFWLLDGPAAFAFVVLEQCPRDMLIQREQAWLDSFESPLNSSRSAKGGAANRGKYHGPHSPEWGAKIADGNRRAWADPEVRRLRGRAISTAKKAAIAQRLASGQPAYAGTMTNERRQHLSEAQRGHAVSKEARLKISAALKGRPQLWNHNLSVEARAKISAANRGRPLADAHRAAISRALKGRPGRPHTEATKRAIGEASRKRRGEKRGPSPKGSLANLRTWSIPEIRARRIAGLRARINKQQRSDAALRQWEKRREAGLRGRLGT